MNISGAVKGLRNKKTPSAPFMIVVIKSKGEKETPGFLIGMLSFFSFPLHCQDDLCLTDK